MNLKIKIRKTNEILKLSKEDKLFACLDNEWIKLEKLVEIKKVVETYSDKKWWIIDKIIYCYVCLAFKYRFRKFYRIFNKLNNIRK